MVGMTETTQRTFTATVEAQYADEMRARRAKTDTEIAAEYPVRPSRERVERHRAADTSTRTRWERDAAERALAQVTRRAREGVTRPYGQPGVDEGLLPTRDLDGATITITIRDLVATATLTVPEKASE